MADALIRIVDFKTGRRVPRSTGELPSAHVRQMAAYTAALETIFPGRQVEATLLYTSGPVIWTVPDAMLAADGGALVTDAPQVNSVRPAEQAAQVDLAAVAAARSSLRAKLERNRKIRFTNFDPLSTGSGIVHDNADNQFAVQWEDSFITPEDAPPHTGA